MYSEGSSSDFYNELVQQPFFQNHVYDKTHEMQNRIDGEIDKITEMVERAEIAAEFVPCSDDLCGDPVPRQDVLRCHESNRPFCEPCFVEHRQQCQGCQEAQKRMQEAIRCCVAK